jgi:hypothetical protein
MNIQVRTEMYEFSHGHTPRGSHGTWLFEYRKHGQYLKTGTFFGSYSKTKLLAIKEARSLEADEVVVAP